MVLGEIVKKESERMKGLTLDVREALGNTFFAVPITVRPDMHKIKRPFM